MKKAIIILFFAPVVSLGQLSNNQLKQVNTLIATSQKATLKILQDSINRIYKKLDSLAIALDTSQFIIKDKIASIKPKQ